MRTLLRACWPLALVCLALSAKDGMGRGLLLFFVLVAAVLVRETARLVTEVLARAASYGLIDRNARKGQKPSDHTPVLIDVAVD